MNTTELLKLFRTEVFDLEAPYLWSDALVYGYIDDAQKQFCRDTYGIADARNFKLDIAPGVEWYAMDPRILKLRNVTDRATGLPVPVIPVEKMVDSTMKFDGTVGTLRALISGLEDNTLRTWPIPFARSPATARANSTQYAAGSLISVTAGGSTKYCQCVASGFTAVAQGALYDGAGTALIADGTARFSDETARLTSTVELRTFRLPTTVGAGDDFEVDPRHHRYLLYWVKHLAYDVQDSETYDKAASEKFKTRHTEYCFKAKLEQSRAMHSAGSVIYGGL